MKKETTKNPIKVFIVDDQKMIREGLKALIKTEPDLEVIGTANNGEDSIKQVEALRQKYFDAGKLPYSKSEAVWQKFKAATKQFNHAKNAFYKQEKNTQQDNLKKKLELIELAESLKDSEDWETTTEIMKKIQSSASHHIPSATASKDTKHLLPC